MESPCLRRKFASGLYLAYCLLLTAYRFKILAIEL